MGDPDAEIRRTAGELGRAMSLFTTFLDRADRGDLARLQALAKQGDQCWNLLHQIESETWHASGELKRHIQAISSSIVSRVTVASHLLLSDGRGQARSAGASDNCEDFGPGFTVCEPEIVDPLCLASVPPSRPWVLILLDIRQVADRFFNGPAGTDPAEPGVNHVHRPLLHVSHSFARAESEGD